MTTKEDIAYFDSYIDNQLNVEERRAFEDELTSSKAFKHKFDRYKREKEAIFEAFEYGEVKNELKQLHRQLYPKRKKVFFLRTYFLIGTGIAASIALVFTLNLFDLSSSTENSSDYQMLANHDKGKEEPLVVYKDYIGGSNDEIGLLDTIIISDTLNKIETLPLGTAFLIHEEGYFLTARHLIQNRTKIPLQQKDKALTFEAAVVYVDTLTDFAILRSSFSITESLDRIPYRFANHSTELGEEVFTLGYSKKEIVYTEGVVSSETGFESDSAYYEVSLPSNAGNSGAPLFNFKGELTGMITANHSKKQSVTYILRPNCLETVLRDSLHLFANKPNNYLFRTRKKNVRIKKYRSFVFEVH